MNKKHMIPPCVLIMVLLIFFFFIDVGEVVPPKRIRRCLNNDATFQQQEMIWSMVDNNNTGSVASLVRMINQIKMYSGKDLPAMLLEVLEDPISPIHKHQLKSSGWKFCTVPRVGNNNSDISEQFARFRLWEMTELKTIVFVSPYSHITADVSPLLKRQLPKNIKIGASRLYDRHRWSNSFSSSVFILHPSILDSIALSQAYHYSKVTYQKSRGFELVLNNLWSGNDGTATPKWIEIGFEYSADTSVFRVEPFFWRSRQYDIRIMVFNHESPWDYNSCKKTKTENLCQWWATNKSSRDVETSIYHKLWKSRSTMDETTTAEPLEYDPLTTPDPRPLSSRPDILNERTLINSETTFINTSDRRIKRIKKRIDVVSPKVFKCDANPETYWKLVIGIPSVDNPRSRRNRDVQRRTWMTYSNVWNINKNVDASVLVKYVLAYPPPYYELSPNIISESNITNDIVYLNLREGEKPKRGEPTYERKTLSVLVGMSRKTYAWFCFAADTYKTDYIMKGDDDAFYRTLMIVNELQSYRIPRVYHGRGMIYHGIFRTGGFTITLSYDLVDWIRDSKLVEKHTDFAYEDVMVGLWFYRAGVTAVNNISDCRCHDSPKYPRPVQWSIEQPIKQSSMIIHHVHNISEWNYLLSTFPDHRIIPLQAKTYLTHRNGIFWHDRYSCPAERRRLNWTFFDEKGEPRWWKFVVKTSEISDSNKYKLKVNNQTRYLKPSARLSSSDHTNIVDGASGYEDDDQAESADEELVTKDPKTPSPATGPPSSATRPPPSETGPPPSATKPPPSVTGPPPSATRPPPSETRDPLFATRPPSPATRAPLPPYQYFKEMKDKEKRYGKLWSTSGKKTLKKGG